MSNGARPASPAHRPDIDGLRALAILPVLLFHAHVPGFPGGYVGVDIFFVISGFLITGIIAREVDERRFSLLAFYERRARRILPALGVMMLVVLGLAIWLYLPGDFEDVPRSALAATLFLSNLFFFTNTGYFAGGADTKPLLHTWSLAVEEQFYIGFPLLLLLISRLLPQKRTAILTLLAAFSLALSILMRHDASGFAFYLLPTRAWELLAGGLLALGAVPPLRPGWPRESAAFSGLAAIAIAVATFDATTPFPGIAAVLPVLGAAALLHCAPGTMAGRLLSWRGLTGVGLISYSLYLWHWPLIVFTEYATDQSLHGGTALIVILGAIGLATLSWRFIEQPFRNRRRIGPRAILAMSAALIAVLALSSAALLPLGPWPARFAPQVLALANGKADISPKRKACHDTALRGASPCVLGAPVKPDALLWGDSHGVEIAYALGEQARAGHRSLIQHTTSSCAPALDYAAAEPRCVAANRAILRTTIADPSIRRVYLIAFWVKPELRTPDFIARLDATIAALVAAGKQVTVIGPVPPQGVEVPRHLAHLAAYGQPADDQGVDPAATRTATTALHTFLAKWQKRGVRLIEPMDALCDSRHCALSHAGKPLYFDSHHLSVTGTRRVVANARLYD